MIRNIKENIASSFERLRVMSATHKTAFFLMLENVDLAMHAGMPFEDYLPFQQDMGFLMEMIQKRQPVSEPFVDLLVRDLESVIKVDSEIISEKRNADIDEQVISFATMILAMHEIMERLSTFTLQETEKLVDDFETEDDSMYFPSIEELSNEVASSVIARLMNLAGIFEN